MPLSPLKPHRFLIPFTPLCMHTTRYRFGSKRMRLPTLGSSVRLKRTPVSLPIYMRRHRSPLPRLEGCSLFFYSASSSSASTSAIGATVEVLSRRSTSLSMLAIGSVSSAPSSSVYRSSIFFLISSRLLRASPFFI